MRKRMGVILDCILRMRFRLPLIALTLLFASAFYSVTVDAQASNGLIFIHHSVGDNWLNNSLRDALNAKTSYIGEVNEITYGTDVNPDSSRPDSLGPTPGDNTDMNHWILWFNDYLNGVKNHKTTAARNGIIMFKSCFPNSDIADDGVEPGDPFSGDRTLANYRAVYRHASGGSYTNGGQNYRPLEDIFAENPDTLFIVVTAPPQTALETTNEMAHRARLFNNWLKGEWLNNYHSEHVGLYNVAVFDLFNVLANPDDAATNPNRLKDIYHAGQAADDSHPNDTASAYLTQVFAANSDNFIDAAWTSFSTATPPAGGTDDTGGTDNGGDTGTDEGGGTGTTQQASGSSCSAIPAAGTVVPALILMSLPIVFFALRRKTK